MLFTKMLNNVYIIFMKMRSLKICKINNAIKTVIMDTHVKFERVNGCVKYISLKNTILSKETIYFRERIETSSFTTNTKVIKNLTTNVLIFIYLFLFLLQVSYTQLIGVRLFE